MLENWPVHKCSKYAPLPQLGIACVGRGTNELPRHYFKTDLVGNLAPGNTARSSEIHTFRECLNIGDEELLKSSKQTTNPLLL